MHDEELWSLDSRSYFCELIRCLFPNNHYEFVSCSKRQMNQCFHFRISVCLLVDVLGTSFPPKIGCSLRIHNLVVMFKKKDELLYDLVLHVYQFVSVSYRPATINELSNHNNQNGRWFNSCSLIVRLFTFHCSHYEARSFVFFTCNTNPVMISNSF